MKKIEKAEEKKKVGEKMGWKERMPKEHRYFETENGILYNGDVLEILKQLPDESIDTVITSPPYWGAEILWK